MRHLSAAAFIVLLIVLPSCKYFKGKGLFGKKADTLVAWQARQDSLRVVDSIRKVQDQLMAIEKAKLDSARKADEERSAFETKYKYNIIVGSFITPEYAEGYSDVYKKMGYNTRIIKLTGSKFELVAAESHESFRKAAARLKAFQDTVNIDAWLYIYKRE